jgi:hypothetical protein
MIETKTIYTFKYCDLKPLIHKYYFPDEDVKLTPELLASLNLPIKGVYKFEEIEDLKMLVIGTDEAGILHGLQKVVITKIREIHGVDFNEETNADTYFIDFDR